MAIELARIIGNLAQMLQIGSVNKVKGVTPRPEEGRNTPPQFGEVQFKRQREKRQGKGATKKTLPKKDIDGDNIDSTGSRQDSEDKERKGEEERYINVVIEVTLLSLFNLFQI